MSEVSKKTKSKKKEELTEEEKAKQVAMDKRKMKALKQAYQEIKAKHDAIADENKKLLEKMQKHEEDVTLKTQKVEQLEVENN